MESLTIEKKKPLIKQNKIKYFIIKKYEEWEWCIELKFDFYDDIDLINLFLITKSFINDLNIICYSISINYLDKEDKIIVSDVLRVNKFKKMSFIDFEDWYETKMDLDSKYNVKNEYISFIFHFEKSIILLKKIDLNEVSPIYPWKNEFLEIWSYYFKDYGVLKKKNEILEKENIELKKEIIKLEKKIKEKNIL